MDFEQDMKQLEKIIAQLETGNLSLDENIKLYEEGVILSKKCLKALDSAKLKISEINKETAKEEDLK